MASKLTPAGWVRLVIYVLSGVIGVAAVVCTSLGYTEIAHTLSGFAAAGAAITGGTAVVNLPKAPDQNRGGLTADVEAFNLEGRHRKTGGLPVYDAESTAGA